jgi:acetyl esterase/lipase
MVAVALVMSACSHGKDQTPTHHSLEASHTVLGESQAMVAHREAPEIRRVPYPVSGPGDEAQNWGDLFLPAGDHREGSVPLVVLVHGGGWQAASGAQDMNEYAEDLTTRGVAVYNIEYRRVGSGGGWPETFTDVAAAVDHVPELLAQNSELSGSVELAGHSAGAQLALWAGTRRDTSSYPCANPPRIKPARIVALAGPLDMQTAARSGDAGLISVMGGVPSAFPKCYQAIDPILNTTPSVPVVAIHGSLDRTVPAEMSRKYIRRLDGSNRRGGTPVRKKAQKLHVVATSAGYPTPGRRAPLRGVVGRGGDGIRQSGESPDVFRTDQVKAGGIQSPGKQWRAAAQRDGRDRQPDFVEGAHVRKLTGQVAPADHPNGPVCGRLPDLRQHVADRPRNQLDLRTSGDGQVPVGEDDDARRTERFLPRPRGLHGTDFTQDPFVRGRAHDLHRCVGSRESRVVAAGDGKQPGQ